MVSCVLQSIADVDVELDPAKRHILSWPYQAFQASMYESNLPYSAQS